MSDQTDPITPQLDSIRLALESRQQRAALEILLDQHPADRAEIFNRLTDLEQSELLRLMDTTATADLLEELTDQDALEAIESMPTDVLADILDEMEPDEAADLLGDLPPDQASQALAQMEDAEEVLPLLGYPDETAGGRMTTSFIGLKRHTTATMAIDFLRQISPDAEVPYYLYVVDARRHLIGVVGLRELIVAEPETPMEDILDPDVFFVTAEMDQEEVALVMSRYDLAAVPVVDADNHLVGVITHDDIVDVLQEEATEDIYRLANVSDTDLQPDSSLGTQLRGRLPWLYLSMLTSLLAAWVISLFEDLIAQVAVLAIFQSVVAGLGGNAVSQNMAMVVRSLALGRITSRQIWPILLRQMLVGLLQGMAIGLVVGLGVYFWRGNLYLSVVLGLALVGNMIVAGVFGTLVPLGLSALRQDPALASSVLVTAATDSMGFLIFLSLAARFLSRLQTP